MDLALQTGKRGVQLLAGLGFRVSLPGGVFPAPGRARVQRRALSKAHVRGLRPLPGGAACPGGAGVFSLRACLGAKPMSEPAESSREPMEPLYTLILERGSVKPVAEIGRLLSCYLPIHPTDAILQVR